MYKRYFRMNNPKCKPEKTEWIEMTGREFYRFVNSPEGCDRHFIDMDDVVLEASESEARSFKAEKNHSYYIQTQEDGWSTLSLYATEDENGCSGEEIVADETQNVEAEVILRMEYRALCAALRSYPATGIRSLTVPPKKRESDTEDAPRPPVAESELQ